MGFSGRDLKKSRLACFPKLSTWFSQSATSHCFLGGATDVRGYSCSAAWPGATGVLTGQNCAACLDGRPWQLLWMSMTHILALA